MITHRGRRAGTFRGVAADKLATALADADASAVQHALARATGNYKRGNERRAR